MTPSKTQPASEPVPSAPTRRPGVQSVDRAFAALGALQHSSIPLSVQDVARNSGLDRTVAHRLLKTLSAHKMVSEERGAYQLGPMTVLMAARYTESFLVRRLALPYMVDLQSRDLAQSSATVNLSIVVDDVSAVLERIWTPSTPLDLVLSSGDLFPVDRTATGRSILAYLDEDVVETILGPERHAQARPALQRVRTNGGIAVSEGEAIPGVRAIAAAVLTKDGSPVASIGISSPDPDLPLTPESAVAAKLVRSAHAVGKMLA